MRGKTTTVSVKSPPSSYTDWSKYGLLNPNEADRNQANENGTKGKLIERNYPINELYNEEQENEWNDGQQFWWKNNFLLTENSNIKFGTWDGVFTSCLINIFGVVIFLRTGWMLGNAGIGLSILIIIITSSIALIAVLSAIGVCERCKIESGGVYFLLSHVLGARFGASIGIIYCIGQAIAASLCSVGLGESICLLFHWESDWVAKAIAIVVSLLLLGINLAGVKWVIRLQLILLALLCVSVLDFLIGSFISYHPEYGVLGYDRQNWRNNSGSSFVNGQSFFSVFGVFFPTATGVFAGVNMSGELRDPKKSIPQGTLSAVGVSTFLYLMFAVVMAGTCDRSYLQTNYMIAEMVSWWGPLFLIGLYVSSLSSSLGALTGAPRVLQAIAESTELPLLNSLGKTFGPNKVPVVSLVVIVSFTLLFILLGTVNALGPIVTMPYMLTYAALDYAYFALAMSFDIRNKRHHRLSKNTIVCASNENIKTKNQPVIVANSQPDLTNDLDHLFPSERADQNGGVHPVGTSGQSFFKKSSSKSAEEPNDEIMTQPYSFYSVVSNRWLSLFGALFSTSIMIAINWIYAFCIFICTFVLFVYIGQANPGVFPGIAEFDLVKWLRTLFRRCCTCCFGSASDEEEEILITPHTPYVDTHQSQLTEDNADFESRGRYHQTRTQELHE